MNKDLDVFMLCIDEGFKTRGAILKSAISKKKNFKSELFFGRSACGKNGKGYIKTDGKYGEKATYSLTPLGRKKVAELKGAAAAYPIEEEQHDNNKTEENTNYDVHKLMTYMKMAKDKGLAELYKSLEYKLMETLKS